MKHHPLSLGPRFLALFYDWLLTCLYLICLALAAWGYYNFVHGSIPVFTEKRAHWIAFLTSVLPAALYCIWTEASAKHATPGKRNTGLKVIFAGNVLTGSIIRNLVKFLPWQLGHMAAIGGTYRGFDHPSVWLPYGLSLGLAATYVLMVIMRKDHRHLGDLLARTRVTSHEL